MDLTVYSILSLSLEESDSTQTHSLSEKAYGFDISVWASDVFIFFMSKTVCVCISSHNKVHNIISKYH